MSERAASNTRKGKRNPLDLKSRLFEKGIGHSSISSFKSPLASNSNRTLLVNLASSKYRFINIFSAKNSPKVIRKQVAFFSNSPTNSVSSVGNTKNYMIRDHVKTVSSKANQANDF